ncbi:MAG: hypothetical protein JKY94_17370 [Rhodobacteraceae bacterium]|nr:hypothetical protein [Paracoccaceae bacterium]
MESVQGFGFPNEAAAEAFLLDNGWEKEECSFPGQVVISYALLFVYSGDPNDHEAEDQLLRTLDIPRLTITQALTIQAIQESRK